jgi:Insertion element 4 transposase N-terminal/Transposase DDE domain
MRGKILAGVGVGVLSRFVTAGLVDEVVAEAGAVLAAEVAAAGGRPRRPRLRVLPDRLGVFFVLGLCLFSDKPYAEVLKELVSGLREGLAAAGWQVPATTGLTKVRRRLGEKPLELLFWRLRSALSPCRAPWSHIGGLLAVAWDGTTVKAAASPENIAAFGRTGGTKDNPAHYPQLRLVTLIACGTRGLAGAAMGPVAGRHSGERAVAARLLGCLHPGMLLLADRGFYSWQLWQAAAGTGADLLWRVTGSLHLPVVRVLPDGSWLSVLADPAAARRRINRNGTRRRRGSTLPPDTGPLPGITVRVIEFGVQVATGDGGTRTERYRVITTLLDWRACPAAELAAGYAWRWAIETGFREFKTYLRGPGRILRGRTPALARQELWAYLVIYQAIRAVICLASAARGLDPDRISFTVTLHAIRRTLTAARTRPGRALAETEADALSQLVPERRGRVCVRAVTESGSPYKFRNSCKDPISQHAQYTITIATPTATARPPASQPEHPADRGKTPP